MTIDLERTIKKDQYMIGELYINNVFHCYTLEDTFRDDVKIYAETAIPDMKYEIKLRTEGGMNDKYKARFGEDHKGMLWLQDVPNFEWVYIHIGNTAEDTEGCILVGKYFDRTGYIYESKKAYLEIYKKISVNLLINEKVFINIYNNY